MFDLFSWSHILILLAVALVVVGPKDLPKLPHDVLATIYRHLDVDLTQQAIDHQGRPHAILPQGSPIDELF